MPRRWVETYEDYAEDWGENVEKPGFWSGGWKEPAYTLLVDWPDSPSGPTRKAIEWIVANEKVEVSQ